MSYNPGGSPSSGLTDAQLRASAVAVSFGPVSIANFPASQAVTGTFWPTTQPVSGTFWQTTQPVSIAASVAVTGPLTDAQIRATPLPISGTVAVSGSVNVTNGLDVDVLTLPALPAGSNAIGSVTVSNFPASQAVTGAFYPATQPVSGPLTNTELRASGIAVTGTFFQATQPVSIAATVAVSGPVTDAQLRASAVPVSLAALPALVAGSAVIGAVTQSGTWTLTPPTLTKGTQAATGFSTQDLKDAGRNQSNLFMGAPIITTTAEVMLQMTGFKAGAAVAATATPAVVTAGKTYRITKIVITYFNVAALGSARVNMRVNTGGVAVVGSPLYMTWQVGLSGDGASTAGHASTYDFAYPEGLEFAAGTGIAFGVIGEGVVPTTGTAVGYVLIQCFGFEY